MLEEQSGLIRDRCLACRAYKGVFYGMQTPIVLRTNPLYGMHRASFVLAWSCGWVFVCRTRGVCMQSAAPFQYLFELMEYDRPGFLPKWHIFYEDNGDVPGSLKWREPSLMWNNWPVIAMVRG